MAILAGVTPSESDKVRHSALVRENLIIIIIIIIINEQGDLRLGPTSPVQAKIQ